MESNQLEVQNSGPKCQSHNEILCYNLKFLLYLNLKLTDI